MHVRLEANTSPTQLYVPVHDRNWARGHSALACFANTRRSFGGCSNRIALRIGRRALVAKGRRLGSCWSPGLPSITTSNHCSISVLARSFLGLFFPRSFSIIVLSGIRNKTPFAWHGLAESGQPLHAGRNPGTNTAPRLATSSPAVPLLGPGHPGLGQPRTGPIQSAPISLLSHLRHCQSEIGVW